MIEITIGNQLKHYREQQSLSLDEVSALTEVSKTSLSNIEHGNTSPSINTLWKLAKGLSLPISYFFAEKDISYEKVNMNNLKSIESGDHLVKIFTAFSRNPTDTFEVLFLELDSGARRSSKAHSSGTNEILIPIDGKIGIRILDNEILLSKNEIFRFDATIDHEYFNVTNQKSKFICIMTYNTLGGK